MQRGRCHLPGRLTALCGLAALVLSAGACSSVSNMLGTSSSEDKPAEAAGPTPSTSAGTATAATTTTTTDLNQAGPDDYSCPEITVRSGAATLLIGAKTANPGESDALNLRYQGTFVRFARECTPQTTTMTERMKIGINGRVIVGPAGGPGTIDVPIRIAVVREGPEPKLIVSKLARVQVTVAEGAPNAEFTYVDPDVAYPLPKYPTELENYVVYVGFDPAPVKVDRKPPPRRKR